MTSDCRRLVFVLWLLNAAGGCHGVYKRWTSNTNFDNADNWSAKRPPCGNDRVVMPDDGVLVYLTANTTIQELVLPLNGEVLLSNDATLAFTNTPDTSGACPQAVGDVTFEVAVPRQWVDPRHWCWSDTEGGACRPPPLLDAQQLPCTTDDVIFPRDQSFYVTLGSGMAISVRSLKVSGSSFSTSSWQNYVATQDGQKMFPPAQNPSTLTVSRNHCDDKSGCACGNDRGELFRQMCAIRSRQCDRARCNSPIVPTGSCCDFCGGMLNCTTGRGFDFEEFSNLIKTDFPLPNDTRMSISKTSSGQVQVVVVDRTGTTSSSHVHSIYTSIQNDIRQGGHHYALDAVDIAVSAAAILQPTMSSHTGVNLGTGGKTGIIIAVLVILAVLFIGVLVFVRKRRGDKPFPLDMEDLRGSLPHWPTALTRAPKPAAAVRPTRGDHFEMTEDGFTNPMYGEVAMQELPPLELTLAEQQPGFDDSVGFDNPLYGTAGKGLYSDPTEGEGATAITVGAATKRDSSI